VRPHHSNPALPFVFFGALLAACSDPAGSVTVVPGPVDGDPLLPEAVDVNAEMDGEATGDWVRRLSDGGDENKGFAVAANQAGTVIVGGQAQETPPGGGAEALQALVQAYGSDGERLFEATIRSTDTSAVLGLAVDSDGEILFAGRFSGELDAADETLTSAGGDDVMFGKLSAEGELLWARAFGGPGTDEALTIAVDSRDNLLVGGSISEEVDLGDGDSVGSEQPDAFLVKYNTDGEFVWARTFGSPTVSDAVRAVSIGEGDTPHICGYFGDVFDSGISVHESRGSFDIFAARLSFQGGTEYSKTFGGEAADLCLAMVVDDDGEATIAGSVRGAVEFDGMVTEAGEKPIGYIAHLDTSGRSLFNTAPLGTLESAFYGLSLNEHGGVDVVGEGLEFMPEPAARAVYLQLDGEGHGVEPYQVGAGLAPFATTVASSSSAHAVTRIGDAALIVGEFRGELRLRGPKLGTTGQDAVLMRIVPSDPPSGG
jgi:hypothetical protein